MIQFELDYIVDAHRHWLRDRRFGKRADFTEREIKGLDFSSKDLSGAIFDSAIITDVNFSNTDLTGISAKRVNFHQVDFTDAILKDANLYKSHFTQVTFKNTDLWNVTGDGVYVISMQLGGQSVCYTDEIIQINCKQYRMDELFWATEEELLYSLRGPNYDDTRADLMEWWDRWRQDIQRIVYKNPAKSVSIPRENA